MGLVWIEMESSRTHENRVGVSCVVREFSTLHSLLCWRLKSLGVVGLGLAWSRDIHIHSGQQSRTAHLDPRTEFSEPLPGGLTGSTHFYMSGVKMCRSNLLPLIILVSVHCSGMTKATAKRGGEEAAGGKLGG